MENAESRTRTRKPRRHRDLSWAGRLDRLLTKAGLSDAQVARATGLDASTINRYRTGDRSPKPEDLAAIIQLAGGSADEILGIRPLGSVQSRSKLQTHLEELEAIKAKMAEALKD